MLGRLAVIALALALALAACGGDDGEDEPAPNGGPNGGDNRLVPAGVTVGFEGGTAGWASLNRATISRTTSSADSGKAALQVETKGSSGFEGAQTTDVLTAPKQAYTATARVRAPKGVTLQIALRERKAADAEIGATTSRFDGTGGWEAVAVKRSFGRKAESARIQIRTDDKARATTFRVDSVSLREAAAG